MLEVAALWIGDRLSAEASACLASFVRQGHPTSLYSYQRVGNVPSGVTVKDASAILSPDVLAPFVAIKKYSQFSNFFRYELLHKHDGICWIDTDLYCVRPVTAEPYIFGWEDERLINGAILAIPSSSPMLSDLQNMFLKKNFVAPWLGRRRVPLYTILAMLGRPVPREKYPWGTLGPGAISWHVRKHGLQSTAKPIPVFYPVAPLETEKFFDPSIDWNSALPPETKTVHLWNELLRKHEKRDAPPKGSFLWKILNNEAVLGG
jgi:hypothetical protein